LAATAETAWALILALTKRLIVSDKALHDGRWQPDLADALMGRTLGLVGLGQIGQRMAQIGAAFGMEVLAWSPHLTPERAARAGARAVSKGRVVRASRRDLASHGAGGQHHGRGDASRAGGDEDRRGARRYRAGRAGRRSGADRRAA